MLGFERNDLQGLKQILERLSNNPPEDVKLKTLTHKEMRAFARGILVLIPHFEFPSETESKLKILVTFVSMRGFAIYDRAFFAKEALEVIQGYENSLPSSGAEIIRKWDVNAF